MNQQKPNIECSQCGAAFRCGATAGEKSCWCASLPKVMPVPKEGEAQGCLCPDCLKSLIEKSSDSNSFQKV